MINHYNDENLKKIEELKEILRGYHARREIGDIHEETYDNAIENFVKEFGCNYDWFASYGVDLLNSDHEDLREIIEKFLESGCKTWDEFCIYLLEKLIHMIKATQK